MLSRPTGTHVNRPPDASRASRPGSATTEAETNLVQFQERIYERMNRAQLDPASANSRLFVLVGVAGKIFAIDSVHVGNIVEVPPIAPIPASTPGARGLVEVGGTVYAVIDASRQYGNGRDTALTYTSRLVCLTPDVDVGLALLVDRIENSVSEDALSEHSQILTAERLREAGVSAPAAQASP